MDKVNILMLVLDLFYVDSFRIIGREFGDYFNYILGWVKYME